MYFVGNGFLYGMYLYMECILKEGVKMLYW